MEKFTEDLNIIRSLPDNPALTSDEFRSKFDEAGKKIKEYINNILGPEVESKAGEEELTQLNIKINNSLTELEGAVNQAISEFTTEVNNSLNSVSSTANSKTNYSDFVVTTHSIHYVRTQSQGEILEGTYTNNGCKPLGLVGQYYTNLYSGWAQGVRITSINDTTINIQGYVARGNTGGTTEGDLVVNILWVKVK
jgi:hypothetical protein